MIGIIILDVQVKAMSVSRTLSFDIVEKAIRKMDYGILGTIDKNGCPHSTSVLYGVSPSSVKFALYVITGKSYKKTKNLKLNPQISFVIPIPHHIMRFVPSNCIQFQGSVEFLSIKDEIAKKTFLKNKVLKMTREDALSDPDEYIFLKIIPKGTVFGYGLGMGIMELRNNHESGSFRSKIPTELLN